jgi:hypothetical protein
MKSGSIGLQLIFAIALVSWTGKDVSWVKKDCKSFNLNYTVADTSLIDEYQKLIDIGLSEVEKFFNEHYKKKFEVFIYPGRTSLDSAWEHDWKIPGFKSECWMVASGIADRIDILSPVRWDAESCEHKYSDKRQTRLLITHELVHVFHGQSNVSPDFSNVKNIDWFVEGLATYASGQCDSNRIEEVIKAINDRAIPRSTDQFWTGKLKYGQSGSLVMYIDKKYGRGKLKELLKYNENKKILATLNTNESDLLAGWKQYMLSLASR